MDNPHIQDVEIAYFAGLIDGEGTITLERTGNRRMNGITGLSPKIIVANTDLAIIEVCKTYFKRLGVKPHIKSQLAGKYNRGKTMYWVTIQGLSKCKKVLPKLIPYLVGKAGQARLLLDFIDHRGNSQEAKGKPYGEYEMRILDQIRSLNHRGVSETEDHGLRHKIMKGK